MTKKNDGTRRAARHRAVAPRGGKRGGGATLVAGAAVVETGRASRDDVGSLASTATRGSNHPDGHARGHLTADGPARGPQRIGDMQ